MDLMNIRPDVFHSLNLTHPGQSCLEGSPTQCFRELSPLHAGAEDLRSSIHEIVMEVDQCPSEKNTTSVK